MNLGIFGAVSDSGRVGGPCAKSSSSSFSFRARTPLMWITSYAAFSLFWYIAWRRDPQIASENRAMENFEALCLVIGMGLLIGAIRSIAGAPQKILLFGLTLFYFTILVLEMDTRKMNVPIWLVGLTNGTIRDVWLGSCWLIAAGLFLRRRSGTLACFRSWLRTAAGKLMLGSGVFWAAALIAERLFQVSFFIEEILECNAALLMSHSAWLTSQAACNVLGRTSRCIGTQG